MKEYRKLLDKLGAPRRYAVALGDNPRRLVIMPKPGGASAARYALGLSPPHYPVPALRMEPAIIRDETRVLFVVIADITADYTCVIGCPDLVIDWRN